MPRGRILSLSISYSVRIESMSEWAQLLFDRIVIHADDWGRLEGAPAVVKAKVKPMSPRPVDDFANAIAEMVRSGALVAYGAGSKVYLQVTKHDEHQIGLHKRRPSRYPDPTMGREMSADEYLSGGSGKFPEFPGKDGAEEKGREEKGREGEGSAATENTVRGHQDVATFPSRDDLSRIAAAIEPSGMMVTGGFLAQWVTLYGADFTAAVIEDVGPSLVGKGPSYLHAILRERHAAGWTPRQAKPAAVYSEPTPRKVTVDDVRHLQWLVSHPENYDPPAPGCTLDDVRDYLEAVVRDGEIVPDAKPIDEWIRRTA